MLLLHSHSKVMLSLYTYNLVYGPLMEKIEAAHGSNGGLACCVLESWAADCWKERSGQVLLLLSLRKELQKFPITAQINKLP